MKCVGIQHLEAVARLKSQGKRLKRTVHITFVPDEEIGGVTGMKLFVKTEAFQKLNVGFALDEGLASGDTEEIPLYYGERNRAVNESSQCFTVPARRRLLLINDFTIKILLRQKKKHYAMLAF